MREITLLEARARAEDHDSGSVQVYVPIVFSIILSIVLTVVLNVILLLR